MQGADLEVVGAARGWLAEGRRVCLVAVARTYGSSPRPPGSLLAIADDGRFAGSVSGGCVEEDLVARLTAPGAWPGAPCVESYGVTPEQTHRFGLPCGGRLDLVVEPLAHAAALEPVERALRERRLIARRLCLATGEASLHTPVAGVDFRFDGRDLVKVYGPSWRLLAIGAGQLSRCLAEMATALDYRVIVCDPREEYARQWRLEHAELDTRMPDDVVRALAPDARTAVVALTHDPKLDDLALLEALASDAFYVGALGSKANNAKRRARLVSLGVTAEQLARLHGPVGLPIGARTPPEIALAILAQLAALRHGVRLAPVEDAVATAARHGT